ncbi:hypothetical protein [Burkholderia glumae]
MTNNTTAPALTDEQRIRASMTGEQIRLERKLTCEAIEGAIGFGQQGTNPPPSDDHWLAPFWKIGQQLALLTSPRAAVPEGWKLVPIVPTRDMLECLWDGLPKGTAFRNCTPLGIYAAMLDAAPAAPVAEAEPIPILLFCPRCGTQHIDRPESHAEADASIGLQIKEVVTWTNPPHRSHMCHACGCIWRPADVATVGVKAIETRGKADTWEGMPGVPSMPAQAVAADGAAMGKPSEIERVIEERNDAWAATEAFETDLAEILGTEPGSGARDRIYEAIVSLKRAAVSPATADERAARLDDADIDAIAESMPGGLGSFMKQWGWRQFARAVEDEVVLNVARASQAVAPARIEALRKGLFNARDALRAIYENRVTSNATIRLWIEDANRVLNGEQAAAPAEAIDRYQAVCAAAYQLAGVVGAPLRFLDALSDAANGEPMSADEALNLLPVGLNEIDEVNRSASAPAEAREPSPTAGMNLGERIKHVGGRENAAGYIEFGSVAAVGALIKQVIRDLPRSAPADAGEAVASVDETTFKNLFYKHGGPVDSEGWCINESGLRDFLADLAAAQGAQGGKGGEA